MNHSGNFFFRLIYRIINRNLIQCTEFKKIKFCSLLKKAVLIQRRPGNSQSLKIGL